MVELRVAIGMVLAGGLGGILLAVCSLRGVALDLAVYAWVALLQAMRDVFARCDPSRCPAGWLEKQCQTEDESQETHAIVSIDMPQF